MSSLCTAICKISDVLLINFDSEVSKIGYFQLLLSSLKKEMGQASNGSYNFRVFCGLSDDCKVKRVNKVLAWLKGGVYSLEGIEEELDLEEWFLEEDEFRMELVEHLIKVLYLFTVPTTVKLCCSLLEVLIDQSSNLSSLGSFLEDKFELY